MSEVKFTPGPWFSHKDADKNSCGGFFAVSNNPTPGAYWICELFGGQKGGEGQEEANARLISAAPELLKELQHLVDLIEPMDKEGSFPIPGLATLNGARFAIAKAKGQQ